MMSIGQGELHRLATPLLDAPAYPANEWVGLYPERWEIEIGNDEIKTDPLHRPVSLRRLTPCGVRQEIYGILLAYNSVCQQDPAHQSRATTASGQSNQPSRREDKDIEVPEKTTRTLPCPQPQRTVENSVAILK